MALIKCPKCEAEISDQCGICPHCGEVITKNELTKEDKSTVSDTGETKEIPSGKNISKQKKNPWVVFGLVVGIVAVVAGLIILFTSNSTLDYASFGGDFYTYTYKGIRAAEIAVRTLTRAVGVLIAIIGALTICKYGEKL